MELHKILNELVSMETLNQGSAEDIVSEICTNLYSDRGLQARANFEELPMWLQDIILIIDFDTELNMNGIIGFLENSTGSYLDETIDSLRRIGAIQDYVVLTNIKLILISNGIDPRILRVNMNNQSEYKISSSQMMHGLDFDEVLDEAEDLYLNQERSIFDNLFEYVEMNRTLFIREMEE
ncbi:DUF4375 domain-containing protein [Paenibacillus sp.]|jgi:hypothetical protein|uniref:DMP19 family protein n=1 Tax=Paenibacillus sp. TaxID=58172 RepID=UPI00282F945F|nr:DUF4375 domain-containing protein [Paenibacillus sp.]MDR0267219.1 DMP19 family protein [Paenibacillus sp.]